MQSKVFLAADAAVNGDRQLDYGHPFNDFTRIAGMWNAYLGLEVGTIQPEDVANMMIHLKQSRLKNTPRHEDSQVDVAGYTKCYELIRQYRLDNDKPHPKDPQKEAINFTKEAILSTPKTTAFVPNKK